MEDVKNIQFEGVDPKRPKYSVPGYGSRVPNRGASRV